jgi:hypothetical protein
MYKRNWIVKPAGDVDVVEREKLIETMQQSWPVYQATGAAIPFLVDLTEKLFPDSAPKYIKAIQQQVQQNQSQQSQQQQHVNGTLKELAQGIIHLASHPEYFSETGRVHAYPAVETAANEFKQMLQPQRNGAQK